MPFPSSPTDGQTATLSSITYQYSTASNAWTRIGIAGSSSGYSGWSGVSGFSGWSGRSGFSGWSGVGTSGFSGWSGVGTSGFSGWSGISGFSGWSGISGFSGWSGISGFSGWSGISGFSGWSGISGFSGWSGRSGFSGWSGTSGFSGWSGISGFSGWSGASPTTVQTTAQAGNAVYYPTFVDANNASATAEIVYTTSSFVINPGLSSVGLGVSPNSIATVHIHKTSQPILMLSDVTVNSNYGGGIKGFSVSNNGGRLQLGTVENSIFASAITINHIQDVGIGTDSPSDKFSIYNPTLGSTRGNTKSFIRLTSTTANVDDLYMYKVRTTSTNSWEYSGWRIQQKVDATWQAYIQFNGDDHNGANNNAYGISFGTYGGATVFDPIERMRITSGGNVGIGTAAPQATLDIRTTAIIGEFGTQGFFNANGVLHIRKDTKPHFIIESVGENTAGIALNGTSELVFANETGAFSWRTGITYNGDFVATGTERMRITSTGAVGIGTATISGSLLEVHGNVRGLSLGIGTTASGVTGEIRATNEITAYYTSDIRLKENVVEIENAIEKLDQIRGVYFDWTKEYIDQRGGEDGYFVRKHDVGLIAQEVEAVLPEVVATRKDGFKAIKYEKVVALLVSAIKEQQQQITQLQDTINKLSTK